MTRAQETRASDAGFAMAALLVAMAVMAVVMSVLLPVWHTLSVREKEEELMFRGQQYDRAIQLFRKKNAAPGPPNVDALIQGRFLRKKFKDPITGADFNFVGVNAGQPNAPGVQQQPRGFGQLIGSVRSTSKARSFREPDGATTYDQWQFTYVPWKPAGQAVPQTPGAVRECRRVPAVGADPEHVRALRALAPGRVAGAVRARAARPVAPEAASSSPLIPRFRHRPNPDRSVFQRGDHRLVHLRTQAGQAVL
jgi:type II secretory pathway pseudopilin PulG